ncbi:ferrous iron transport protein B [Alkalicella caledoniensis]|uniref:Ferrous iron transport protein B n=1 Tax=Alkalicella caledoniensis TaxID=2731377 RepID=A0A7G9WAE5_ALKCA|nr:ferrous iron transport protein B [Alkalicella caledoniensis]QNO15657.1 ferrous iron transport protein B [Alkalicella caledoniensis]
MGKKIVLVGNPNVGKSVFFNAFTGAYVDVSNFPGTTVDISVGKYKNYEVIDTPGVYGISSFNDEERVTKEVVIQADMIVNVVDANNLERDLFLTLQLLDMGKPMILVLNMIDEAKKNGREIDTFKLSNLIGVEVISTIATKKIGIDKVKEAITRAKKGTMDQKISSDISKLHKSLSQEIRLLILEDDQPVLDKYGLKKRGRREEYYLYRRHRVNEICREVIMDRNIKDSIKLRLSNILIHPLWGSVFLVLSLFLIYIFIGDIVSQRIVDFTEGYIMGQLVEPGLVGLISKVINPSSFLGSLLIGEYGIFTLTITYLLGLLLPLVLGFYFVLAIMEDSGYLPRIAVLLDKLMNKIGLNGKGIIPIILGFGCVTMATITTRVLGSQRERTIATFLLAVSIPCSAQLAVIVGLISPLGGYYIALYIFVMISIFIIIGKLLSVIMPGKSSALLIDLPPLRLPRLKNITKKTYHKTIGFLQDAAPLFAMGAMLIGFLQYFDILSSIQNLMTPLTVDWLGLPKEAANVFIMGLIRRDFGTAGLYTLSLTSSQVLVSLVTITLFVPCIASMMVIIKERGLFSGVITFLLSIVIAFFTGGLLAILV